MGLFGKKYKKIESTAQAIQQLPTAQPQQIIMPQQLQQLSQPIIHRQSPLPSLPSENMQQSISAEINNNNPQDTDMEDKIRMLKAIADLEEWKHFITEKIAEIEMKFSSLRHK